MPGRGRGAAYTLTAEQAEMSGEVVTGIISVHSQPAHVLFDSGASRCFVSAKFVATHGIPCVTLAIP